MYVVVIPYFLVLTSLGAVNETDHGTRNLNGTSYEPPYGLVYTYSVNVDFSKSLERNFKPYYELNLAATLECRPRNDTVLSCILGNRRVDLLYPNHNSHFESIQTGKEFFEINYNEDGVESLRVSSPLSSETSDKRYGLIKTIASQLNVGTYFGFRQSLGFTAKEISTFGECETRFTISTFECAIEETRKNVQMRTILGKSLGDSILLRKERSAKKCDRSSHVSLIENSESAKATATTSYSEMRFCRDSFESSTVFEGKTVTLDEAARASVFRQTVNVRLESVDRTEEDLTTFSDDNTVETIYLHKEVDDNDLDTR